MPTKDTPPPKPQFGNYVALVIFGTLAVLAWLGFILFTWANRGAFHGSDWWFTHLPFVAPAIFLSFCAKTIHRDIRRNQALKDKAAEEK